MTDKQTTVAVDSNPKVNEAASGNGNKPAPSSAQHAAIPSRDSQNMKEALVILRGGQEEPRKILELALKLKGELRFGYARRSERLGLVCRHGVHGRPTGSPATDLIDVQTERATHGLPLAGQHLHGRRSQRVASAVDNQDRASKHPKAGTDSTPHANGEHRLHRLP